MEQITYERPREKLRLRGASSLTSTELLQVVIGSGSVRMPVARMAREVSKVLEVSAQEASYDTLKAMPGLGDATVCRIIAALQLGQRFNRSAKAPVVDVDILKKAKRRSVLYITYDGTNSQLGSYFDEPKANESTLLIAKRVCARALSDKASGVVFAFGYAKQSPHLALFEQSLVNDLKEVSRLLQLRLYYVEVVNRSGRWKVYKGSA